MLNPTYTIDSPESGVEMPPLRRYPFNQMGVGDSILIDDFRLAQSARVSAINYIKRHDLGWKFSIRKMENGWRIFRVNKISRLPDRLFHGLGHGPKQIRHHRPPTHYDLGTKRHSGQ